MSTPLLSQTGQIITEKTCCICLETMEANTSFKINECNHEFHSVCLLTYFRTMSTSSCPLCRHVNETKDTLKFIMNYSRRKNANKTIVSLVSKYKKMKKEKHESEKKFKEFEKEHNILLKERKRLLNDSRNKGILFRRMERKIRSLVVIPLVYQ